MLHKMIRNHRKELHMSNCGFDHDPPEQIVRSQWQSRSKNNIYLAYRWFVAIFFTVTVIESMSRIRTLANLGIFFIYLTHWGILMNMITGIFGAVLVTLWHYKPDYSEKVNKKNVMPTAFKVYWAFHNTTLVTSCVITIIYWSILHNENYPVNATNLLTHAFNSVIMFMDVLIVAYPLRLFHVIQPILFGISYGIFTYIYFLFDGKNMKGQPFIYNVMDWRYPGKTMITVACTHVLAIIVQFALFYVYRIRVFVQRRISRKTTILPTTNNGNSSSLSDSRVSMVFGSNDGCNNPAFNDGTSKEKA